jgi:hypothetical protein
VPLSNEAIIASPRRKSTRRVCSERISSELSNVRSWHETDLPGRPDDVR